MRVLLIHGMARSPLSMSLLARWLRRAGHQVHFLGYVAALEPFDDIVQRVYNRLAELAARGEPYIVIGHSLGGLLTRAALARTPALNPPPLHLIMLGTPNASPRLARRFRRFWPYRLVNGESGERLADKKYFASLPAPTIPYTIIAGVSGRRGRFSPFGPETNDGIVSVNETRVTRADHPIELPGHHTFLMNNKRVRAVIHNVIARLSV